jgi:hypothetical protein
MTLNRWSDEETQRLRELMKTHGRDFKAIGKLMGRSHQSCEHRWRWINMPADQLARRNAAEAKRKRELRAANPVDENPCKYDFVVRKTMSIPDDVFTERDRRLGAPRTIGSLILGDPPPGYSALDRKRQGLPA